MSQAAPSGEFTRAAADSIPPTLTERIRERPLVSIGVAGTAGFVLGGGAFSRTGMAILMILGRIWLRQAASDVVAKAVNSYHQRERDGHAWIR
jgi:hypothetical protein